MGLGTSRTTILVADDSEGHRRVLEMVLGASNFEVVSTANGHEALTYLQSHTPDLMILDVDMPFASGLDVCDKAKRVSRLRDIPVVIMTSLTDAATRTRAERVGADLLVHKPIAGKDLRGMVTRLLGRANA